MPQRVRHDHILVDGHKILNDVRVVANDIDVQPKDPGMIVSQRCRQEEVPCSGNEGATDGLAFEAMAQVRRQIEVEVLLVDDDGFVALLGGKTRQLALLVAQELDRVVGRVGDEESHADQVVRIVQLVKVVEVLRQPAFTILQRRQDQQLLLQLDGPRSCSKGGGQVAVARRRRDRRCQRAGADERIDAVGEEQGQSDGADGDEPPGLLIAVRVGQRDGAVAAERSHPIPRAWPSTSLLLVIDARWSSLYARRCNREKYFGRAEVESFFAVNDPTQAHCTTASMLSDYCLRLP